ncbi:MAG: Quinone oxidoreductase 1 [Verrucomicrobia subdivision 3 bacterium]|nr:Quinone oxidoreductase 1 [Limisphaerales bacterium]MCS1415502.1 Quinone oxidoreductase 1 [Limisphaerales bacterium]
MPNDTELPVRARAVSVNQIGTYIRGGLIPMSLPNLFAIGCDFAGAVEAVRSNVLRFKHGDRCLRIQRHFPQHV